MKEFDRGFIEPLKKEGVLVIYTGGTIGSMPKDTADKESPQVVVSCQKFRDICKDEYNLSDIGFNIDWYSTEPLDSCNVGIKEWKEIAKAIDKYYKYYEGFVVLHGTDTMVYTATALSFMFDNLSKPVIITGAQRAFMFNLRNDGWQNFITSLYLANPTYSKIPKISEVCIYFDKKVFRGNRTRKNQATDDDAYYSPNFSSLGRIGDEYKINKHLIRKPQHSEFRVLDSFEENVISLNFFPGIQDGDIIERILEDSSLRGVVLMAYGAGNLPTKPMKVLNLISDAINRRNVVFLVVTQCGGGDVLLGMYDTSAKLIDLGISSGYDITPEAALVKVMHLLGQYKEHIKKDKKFVKLVATELQKNLKGEQSVSIFTTPLKPYGDLKLDVSNKILMYEPTKIDGVENDSEYEKIVLRFKGAAINTEKEFIDLKIFVNYSSDKIDVESDFYLGAFKKSNIGLNNSSEPTVLFFDITKKAYSQLERTPSFKIFLDSPGSISWIDTELTIFRKEI